MSYTDNCLTITPPNATLQTASDSFRRIPLTGISPSRPVRRVWRIGIGLYRLSRGSQKIYLFACSLDLRLVSRHCADYSVHIFEFAFSSEYVLSVLCKDNFDGLCYVCHIRGKQVNKCFGKYFVFGFPYKQDYSLCLAPFDRLLDYLFILSCVGLSFSFRLFVSVHFS